MAILNDPETAYRALASGPPHTRLVGKLFAARASTPTNLDIILEGLGLRRLPDCTQSTGCKRSTVKCYQPDGTWSHAYVLDAHHGLMIPHIS